MAIILVLSIAVLALTGCPTRTNIADINRDPGQYAGKEVTIVGDTRESLDAKGDGMFATDDDTGRLWVYSQNFGVPRSGTRVAVTGRVERDFSFGGNHYETILRETKRRKSFNLVRDSPSK